jgi:biopolymer transport protein ExbD
MKFRSNERAAVEINLTPLIDILFLVLVFLVMTATFARRTFVEIDLPRAVTGAPGERIRTSFALISTLAGRCSWTARRSASRASDGVSSRCPTWSR